MIREGELFKLLLITNDVLFSDRFLCTKKL